MTNSPDWIAAEWPAPASVIAGTTLRSGRLEDLQLAGEPCWLEQVHGADVVTARHYQMPPKADGCVSSDPGQYCVVRTADCLPVLLCTTDASVLGAVHAGWRGLAAGVVENAVAQMKVDTTGILAWLGPAISQAAFEVGDEVTDAFTAHESAARNCFERNTRGRWQADLYGLARQRLAAAGVQQVYGGGFCTFQDRERLFSYRRNPDCGRMVSFIARVDP